MSSIIPIGGVEIQMNMPSEMYEKLKATEGELSRRSKRVLKKEKSRAACYILLSSVQEATVHLESFRKKEKSFLHR